jgi:hypothetical protein
MRALGLKEAPGPQGDRLTLAYNPDRAAEDAVLRQALRDQLTTATARESVRPLLKGAGSTGSPRARPCGTTYGFFATARGMTGGACFARTPAGRGQR